MNSKGSRVILILVVSLAAFSSAIKELNEVRQFGLQLNEFVAEWSDKLAPADIPAPVLAKVETCHSKQSEPAVELPWLQHVAQADETTDIEEPETPATSVVTRTPAGKTETPKVKKTCRRDIDPVQFEVKILDNQDVPAAFEFQQSGFKFKTRKHSFIKISPRDREMLKTLNRSINLRIAS